ncbi:MAG: TonB-dependent receptor [Methylophilaceae bacterium]|nr:TonB-dependent receptor [Methylophilaceae bacterium]
MAHGEVRLNQGIKMKKTTIAGLISLLFTTPLLAAETSINANDVIVTASRTPQTKESVIADVTVITQEEIERAGQSTFIELLQSQPGVEISSNGGTGSSSSIFLRGSNSNQVVVLVDGLRINSITDGRTNFGNIPLSQIDRIEILRGPASSLYGQDAIGGVIQIFTKHGDNPPRFNAAIGYGSYNSKSAEAGFSGKMNDVKFSINASSLTTDGFSALRIKNDARNDKDAYRNLSINGAISYLFSDNNEIGIQFLNSDGHAKYDNEYNDFNNFANYRQSSIGLFSKNQITENWKSTVKVSNGIDENNNQTSATSSNNVKSEQRQYSWQNDFSLPLGKLTALAERLEQKLSSNTEYLDTKRNSNGFFLGYLASIEKHNIQVNIRRDDSSQYGTHVTKGLSYSYQLNNNWRAIGSFGTAFKAPTFNDIYYPPYYDGGYSGACNCWVAQNNPNLKPETSENFEAALKYASESQTASVTMYHNKVKDLIALDANYLPANYNATLKGLTLAASQSWDGWLLKGNLDIQSPKNTDDHKLLIRRAREHGALNLSKKFGEWRFDSEVIASSSRFNDAANENRMAGYAILNISANYKIDDAWSAQAKLNNLLDKDYALSLSNFDGTPYNTPGANVFFSLRYSPSY